MGYKDFLIVLDNAETADRLGEYAHSFADAFDAHLTAAGVVASTISAVAFFGEYPTMLLDAFDQTADQDIVASYERFARAGARPDKQSFLKITGEQSHIQERISAYARHFDLTIMGQPDIERSSSGYGLIEHVLVRSGRPILIAPYIQKGAAHFSKIIVAWDGGAPAARALAGALPALQKARSVEVVTVADKRVDINALPGFDVSRHLVRHGVQATEKTLAASDVDIGAQLLSYAADESADMLVMGGYSHSRLREFLLGGTTRTILHSMTLPVLMAH